MGKKTAYLISCSEHYHHRFCILDECLRSRGYHTVYITSDFDHSSKQRFVTPVPGSVQLPVLAYRRNLSVQRILSHFQFAVGVVSYLEKLEQEPDLVVALLPPNFLGHYLHKYKKRHPNVKLVFDIFDMWPETFPSGAAKKILAPVFAVWAWLRNHSLSCADWTMTECEMFRKKLGLCDDRSCAVYLSAERQKTDSQDAALRDDGLDIFYLGAINNIIGISEICALLRELSSKKPITLHIVGMGEQVQTFMDRAEDSGAAVVYYGPIYDPVKKQEIINRCHFGLNIMKEDVCIGLTMKSVDYFSNGLPIVSNIPGDTEQLLCAENAGFQLDAHCAEHILQTSNETWLEMRKHVSAMFEREFSVTAIEGKYNRLLDTIL